MPVYSHSRLSSWENCPLQYRYRYIDRLRTGFQSIEAFVGKCVHEVLEGLYRDLERARSGGAEPYVAQFDRIWDAKYTPNVRVIRPDLDAGYYRAIGARCVRSYWEQYYPFAIDPGKIIGLEMKVELALDPQRRYRMIGFVDRVQHAEPGVIEIHDYKTSASLPREGSLRFDRQLPLYEMALRERFPQTNEVRLIWHFLVHDAEFVERRTARDLDRVKRTCISLIQTVERARDFPAKKGPLCAWCEYQETCPEWEGSRPVASPAFPKGRPDVQAECSGPEVSDAGVPAPGVPPRGRDLPKAIPAAPGAGGSPERKTRAVGERAAGDRPESTDPSSRMPAGLTAGPEAPRASGIPPAEVPGTAAAPTTEPETRRPEKLRPAAPEDRRRRTSRARRDPSPAQLRLF